MLEGRVSEPATIKEKKSRGERASGAHTDVLPLIKGILNASEYDEVKKQFSSLLSMKNQSEY